MAWFKGGYASHYFGESEGRGPARSPIFDSHALERPVCIYGHFNRDRGFGVEDNYPDAEQFVTILRDPFEMIVSLYYYARKMAPQRVDKSRVPTGSLTDFLMEVKPNMLNHFPRQVTSENYREIVDRFFIEIGFTDDLEPSLRRIANALDKSFEPNMLPYLNKTDRDEQMKQAEVIRSRFMEKNRLEYSVYEYARKKFAN